MSKNETAVLKSYEAAKAVFADFGVDAEAAMNKAAQIPVSLQCWQGDDVKGFDSVGAASQNLVTGNYPGAARNGAELRADIDEAFSFSPSERKVNIHSMYGEGGKDRKDVTFADFKKWIDWAGAKGYGVDFNPSFFTHKMMDGNLSLTSMKKEVRDYWIEAGAGSREIAYQAGKALGKVCVNNIWIPDGMKDIPADRLRFRNLLTDSLDKVLAKKYDSKYMLDVLEGKLFSIGAESFTAGSHEYYLAYAIKNNIGVTMDTGHYHLTESVADKISAVAPFIKCILLHVSRGVRWDSDHVVVQSDELLSLFEEITRGGFYNKVHIGLDYFDASINRVAAWAIGLRAVSKAILTSLLQPYKLLIDAESKYDFTARLLLTDELKNLPYSAVWDYLLLKKGIPAGKEFLDGIKQYEAKVLSKR